MDLAVLLQMKLNARFELNVLTNGKINKIMMCKPECLIKMLMHENQTLRKEKARKTGMSDNIISG